jgi:hypothetical protein
LKSPGFPTRTSKKWLVTGGTQSRSNREPKCITSSRSSNTSSNRCESGTKKSSKTSSRRENSWNRNSKLYRCRLFKPDIPQLRNRKSNEPGNNWKKGSNKKKLSGDINPEFNGSKKEKKTKNSSTTL